MPRWPERTRERLVEASFELFDAQGYASTTVEQIADRAGVTPRTFFRHFPDKEEVLFADDDDLLPLITSTITADDEPVRADDLMVTVLVALATRLDQRRGQLRRRQRLIDTDVALTGRELAKQVRWEREIAVALSQRGFGAEDADILAALGFAVFRRALHVWLDEGERRMPLADRVQLDVRSVAPALRRMSHG